MTNSMNWITFLILSIISAEAQKAPYKTLPVFPKNEFRSPVDIPISLTGNFGETRKNHFHMGLDIKTNEREGLSVYAVGDGYVSRINVSPYGYGNALYITHPNGYTSVYGHLQQFNETITKELRKEQYAKQSFSVDLILPKNKIMVKKGDIVALSGNTGGSGGPHLHFEIRDSFERPINPFHFGFFVPDNIAPTVSAVEFFSQDADFISKQKKRIALQKKGDIYTSADSILMINANSIGIAVNTFDRMSNSSSSFGIYSITLSDSTTELLTYKNDRHSFDEKRMIVAHLDYPAFLTEGSRAFHKCFVESGDKLSAYTNVLDKGKINLDDGFPHQIKIVVADFNGNKTIIELKVHQSKDADFFAEKNEEFTIPLKRDFLNIYNTDSLKLNIPGTCLVTTGRLLVTKDESESPKIYSPIYTLNKSYEHLLDNYSIRIRTNVSPALKNKAQIIWKDEKGNPNTRGGTFDAGFVTASVKEFGTFYVSIDTIAPTIKPLTFSSTKPMGGIKKWQFTIKDESSGINSYNAYVDDVWILAAFDAKNALLSILNEKVLKAGEHRLKIIVTDERNNEKIYSTKFIY